MANHQILIVGGGAAGIAAAASLHKRDASLNIAIIEPSPTHYYQPGWTMVGAGVFKKEETVRPTASVMPSFVTHITGTVARYSAMSISWLRQGSSLIGPRLRDWKLRLVKTALPRTTVMILHLTHGIWFKKCAGKRRFSPSRPCRSNAQARRKKPCICRAPRGRRRVKSKTSMCHSAMRGQSCLAARIMCLR